MDLTLSYLLLLVGIIVVVLVVLIIFEGRTNKKIAVLLNEIKSIKDTLDKTQAEEKRIKEIVNTIKTEVYTPLHPVRKTHVKTLRSKFQAPEQQDAVKTAALNNNKNKEKILDKLSQNEKVQTYTNEDFVGSKVTNFIGMAILVCGLGLFVKYAIDKAWINEIGRVLIGLAVSGLFIVFAHFTRNKFRQFSSLILGGAMALQYYIFAIAYFQHGLFGQSLTFWFMVAVTLFSIGFAIMYKEQDLTFIIVVAGFTSPFWVGLDNIQYTTLFSYLLIINVGVIILSFFRKWVFVNITTYAFTLFYNGYWIVMHFTAGKYMPLGTSLFYMWLFYFTIIAIVLIYNIRKNHKFIPFEYTMIISTSLMFYSAGFAVLNQFELNYKGLFTAALALLNLIYFIIFYPNKKVDKGIKFLLFGLTIVFVSLVPPVQLVGKSITIVWAIQMVLLLWLSHKINHDMMKLASLGLTIGMIASLGMDISDIYVGTSQIGKPMTWFANIGFITNFVGMIGLIMNIKLLSNIKNEYYLPFLKIKTYQGLLGAVVAVVFYFMFFLEIKYHVIQQVRYDKAVYIIMGIYNYGFLSLFILPGLFVKLKPVKILSGLFSIVAFILYWAIYHYQFVAVRDNLLTIGEAKPHHYFYHYIIIALLIIQLVAGLINMQKAYKNKKSLRLISLWVSTFMILFVCSSEMENIIVVSQFRVGFIPGYLARQVHYLPYTLLWISISFIMMNIGVFLKKKDLRVTALIIFGVTLLKLFIFDHGYIDRSDQIIAFLTIGPLMVITAFMYQLMKSSVKKVESINEIEEQIVT